MRKGKSPTSATRFRAATGVEGFDEITAGGLPRGRTTLLLGGPGSGKTIFALQFLVHGARACGEPGIFVAFEESPRRIIANAASFGWNLEQLQGRQVFMLDAEPRSSLIQAGNFDLGGLLASLQAKIAQMGARRIVFDALNVILALLPDTAAKQLEIHRLHEWLLDFGITGLITTNVHGEDPGLHSQLPYGFMQFMVDCAVVLNHRIATGMSQRSLRVLKYRGSAFNENELPFVIGANGFEVAVAGAGVRPIAPIARVSSGIKRLDKMLDGGYYRNASVLITGLPGTAKTTLGGAFAEAACRRGESTTFVTFDSDGSEVTRNLKSVGVHFAPQVRSGRLNLVSARTFAGNAETLLVRIRTLVREHRSRCLVIDPLSALSRAGNELTARGVAERLIAWCKADGITLVCTSLLDERSSGQEPQTSIQVSTLADTWIHLDYLVQAGERNRGLSIIKSRGTSHSNQVRELILGKAGVTLADAYTAGGEVLMGTMRWERESAERNARETAVAAGELKRVRVDAEEAVLAARAASVQTEMLAKHLEQALLARTSKSRQTAQTHSRARMKELRGADRLPAPRGK
jgi:circadian clock protein KaiC